MIQDVRLGNRSAVEIQKILSSFRSPDLARYPELNGYTRDQCYQDFFGGGGLYLTVEMLRTLRLKPNDVVLDLGCGKGATSVFLAKHYGVHVIALDLWTPAEFLTEKFAALGFSDRKSLRLQIFLSRTRQESTDPAQSRGRRNALPEKPTWRPCHNPDQAQHHLASVEVCAAFPRLNTSRRRRKNLDSIDRACIHLALDIAQDQVTEMKKGFFESLQQNDFLIEHLVS